MVPEMRKNSTSDLRCLRSQTLHQDEERNSVVATIKSMNTSCAWQRNDAPVNDIARLHKEIHVTGPVSTLIDHARKGEHLPRVWHVSMEVADGHDVARERQPRGDQVLDVLTLIFPKFVVLVLNRPWHDLMSRDVAQVCDYPPLSRPSRY